VGQFVDVLVESALDGDEWASADVIVEGRAAHQAPEIDGSCTVAAPAGTELAVGDIVRARVLAGEGVDLVTEFVSVIDSGRTDPARTASGVGAR
jgi:hypothetical protein